MTGLPECMHKAMQKLMAAKKHVHKHVHKPAHKPTHKPAPKPAPKPVLKKSPPPSSPPPPPPFAPSTDYSMISPLATITFSVSNSLPVVLPLFARHHKSWVQRALDFCSHCVALALLAGLQRHGL